MFIFISFLIKLLIFKKAKNTISNQVCQSSKKFLKFKSNEKKKLLHLKIKLKFFFRQEKIIFFSYFRQKKYSY